MRTSRLFAALSLIVLLSPALLFARSYSFYWYQPQYLDKVDDAARRLQFLAPQMFPDIPAAPGGGPKSTFTLDKFDGNSIGINISYTLSGVEDKPVGLLGLTTTPVPYRKSILISVVYADLIGFQVYSGANGSIAATWCAIPVQVSSIATPLCLPNLAALRQFIDTVATISVANGNPPLTGLSLSLRQVPPNDTRKHPERTGCEVMAVLLESPTAKAGLLEDDIVRTINGAPCTLEAMRSAVNEASAKPEGGTVRFDILRKNQILQLDARYPHIGVNTAALRQQVAANRATANQQSTTPAAGGAAPFRLGISARAVLESDLATVMLPKVQGLLITKVEKDGLAAEMEMLAGDVVIEINGTEINDMNAFTQLVRAGAVEKFKVWRKGQALELIVPQSM